MAETLFIECTSLSISYDVTGIATVSYTVVHDSPGLSGHVFDSISAGGRTFDGYITNAVVNVIPNTDGGWYESSVTLIAIAR